jgi:outer membrane receptor for monomeric catechols
MRPGDELGRILELQGRGTLEQFDPVPQESLLAYEVGVKAGVFDLRVQLNASVFHYDGRIRS